MGFYGFHMMSQINVRGNWKNTRLLDMDDVGDIGDIKFMVAKFLYLHNTVVFQASEIVKTIDLKIR